MEFSAVQQHIGNVIHFIHFVDEFREDDVDTLSLREPGVLVAYDGGPGLQKT